MNKRIIALMLLIMILLLSGCSQETLKDKIDISSRIESCTVFYDHIECNLTDGYTYYATMTKINLVTKWDKSAWKEATNENNTT